MFVYIGVVVVFLLLGGVLWCSFFFSSRRRHTRFDCDWSSDVCSSDLVCRLLLEKKKLALRTHCGLHSTRSAQRRRPLARVLRPPQCALQNLPGRTLQVWCFSLLAFAS